ncbi:aminopeptidase N C-terminal domain-containing protein, partial [Klebsiella pneumoniae]
RDKLLADYDNKWHQDGLVMDKWFILQATRPDADVLDNVKSLLTHRSFTMANPNRVRSLVGAFVMNNPKAFHDKSGKGYEFLTEILCDLNSRNPQVASRLIEP